MKKILIVNQGHTKNYGDVAINTTITHFFEKKGIEVEFMPYWEETVIFGKNYKNIPYRIIANIMRRGFLVDFLNRIAIKRRIKGKNYNAVIIGGGELIGNHEGFNSSLYVLTKMFQKKSIPVYLLGISGDIDISYKLKKRYKEALHRCKKIIVRDSHTENICKNEYEVECIKGTDVVFAYQKIIEDEDIIEENDKEDITVLVPISYNKKIRETFHFDTKEEYFDYMLKLVNRNINKGEKLYITSSVYDDEKFAKEIYEYLVTKIIDTEVRFIKYTNLEDFIKLLKTSKRVISARMHAMILGLIYGNKIEVIPFKKKLQVFKEEYQGIEKNELRNVQKNTYKELEMIYKDINH